MTSVATSYAAARPALEALSASARAALSAYAESRGYLISSRIKTLESVQDKFETGRFRALDEFDDLVALTVIIDLRSQEKEVLSFLRRQFQMLTVRGPNTLKDERIFDFDATRVYCKLPVSDPASLIGQIIFEVQIRTLLQHAWSKVTHPIVYKPSNVDAKKIRLAAETLASLESIDRTMSTFATVARGVKRVRRRRTGDLNKVAVMIDTLVADKVIPKEFRPKNIRRCAENILSLVKSDVSTDAAVEIVEIFIRSTGDSFPMSLSLVELASVGLYRRKMLSRRPHGGAKCFFVSDEMVSLFPESAGIGPRVALGAT